MYDFMRKKTVLNGNYVNTLLVAVKFKLVQPVYIIHSALMDVRTTYDKSNEVFLICTACIRIIYIIITPTYSCIPREINSEIGFKYVTDNASTGFIYKKKKQ